MNLRLRLQPQTAAVCRLEPESAIPEWVRGTFVSVTRTAAELSIVCDEEAVPSGIVADRGWRVLETVGPFAFDVTGVAASLSGTLAGAAIPLLLIATYDTDYVLVKSELLARAVEAFRAAGHEVH
jgi:uncharacterized protein